MEKPRLSSIAPAPTLSDADRNWRRFVWFRVLFNSRFYYPVLAVLFLDLGLSATEYTLLNFAWALAIVVTDVPAGVLADRIGRKPLVAWAAAFMVMEMLLLAFAPRNGGMVLLLCCFGNRILSGMAEGMASGADEALVFDSLAERNRAAEWPLVLDQVLRWQAIGSVIAMLVGGATYDPAFMSHAMGMAGMPMHLQQGFTLRIPILLNLVTALLTLVTALGLREPRTRESRVSPAQAEEAGSGPFRMVVSAARWIAHSPAALFVIIAGVLLDSVSRLFLTFASSYFRLISLPDASYGLIGAALAGLGLLVSPLGRRMVQSGSLVRNYLLLASVAFLSMAGVALQWRYFGVIFVFPLMGAMIALGYMVSYYLNALVDSHRRATVLSFKGFAFNLCYGFASLLFALALRAVRDHRGPEQALAHTLWGFPAWVLCAGLLCALAFRRELRSLHTHLITPPASSAT